MKRNMKQWLAELLNAPVKKPFPILSFPAVQILDVSVDQLISFSDLQAEGMLRIAQRVDAAAAVSLMDLSVEAEAFGARIQVSEDEVPTVLGAVCDSEEDVRALKIPQVGAGRTGVFVEAIRKASTLIQDRPVFAGIIGPYSLAGRLLDVTQIMYWCFDDPDALKLLLEKVTAFLIAYGRAFKEAGANGIMMAEPLAGLLSPALAEEFSAPYVKQIVEALQDEAFLVIYHNCGDKTLDMIDSILSTGAAAYHFGNAIDMKQMLEAVPADTVVMGNVDPAAQFRNGTPESIAQNTKSILERCHSHGNFVISSGCDIPPQTPWENIGAFFAAASAQE